MGRRRSKRNKKLQGEHMEKKETTRETLPVRNNRVFVYGTLKKGCSNSAVMTTINAQYLYDMPIKNAMLHDVGPFPMLTEVNDESAVVHGELYAVDDKGLEYLDQLEGHPYMYKRIGFKQGETKIWTYVGQQEYLADYPIIPSGIWAEAKEKEVESKSPKDKENKSKESKESITIVKDKDGYLYLKEAPKTVKNVFLEVHDKDDSVAVSMALPIGVHDRYWIRIEGALMDSFDVNDPWADEIAAYEEKYTGGI